MYERYLYLHASYNIYSICIHLTATEILSRTRRMSSQSVLRSFNSLPSHTVMLFIFSVQLPSLLLYKPYKIMGLKSSTLVLIKIEENYRKVYTLIFYSSGTKAIVLKITVKSCSCDEGNTNYQRIQCHTKYSFTVIQR